MVAKMWGESSGVTGREVEALEEAAMGQVLFVFAFGEGTWPLHKNTSDHAHKNLAGGSITYD
jgi:hypothetical protein